MAAGRQDGDGQAAAVHSGPAGLDYPGVGPEHSFWKDAGRVRYTVATDDEALEAFQLAAQTEGVLPALETAHAIAEAVRLAPTLGPGQTVLVNLSGRGDKDVDEASRLLAERVEARRKR
ncbi:MAG: hypothetical protein IBJ10_11385 [Phycisphaerales bacterium]|nr:hypothetical protein [Phycisphaerales bacterium]